jgi:DNA-binding NtrC family response regulator
MAEGCDVLVVDDEPVVRDAIRLLLRAAGLQVAVASDAASALAHPAAENCRLLVCDLMLPDLSGIELLERFHAARPGLPAVMITGYATSENTTRAMEAGVAYFLPKPFTESELVDAVHHALRARGGAPEDESP